MRRVIYFIFHGPKMEVDKNMPMEVRANPPLSLAGREHAAEVGRHLANYGTPARVLSSPLVRANQTAEIIAQIVKYPGVVDTTDLRIAQFKSNEKGIVTFMPGHHGDWYPKWQEGMVGFTNETIDQIQPGERYFVVSHRGTIASLLAHFHGIHDTRRMRKMALRPDLVKWVGFIALDVTDPADIKVLFNPFENELGPYMIGFSSVRCN